jgi:cobalamin biosynthesis protein CobD/CbiB
VRSINLLKVAFDAELLRLRAMMARQGRRAAFGVIALIFALVVLALAEATGWLALRHQVESIPATLILLGFNLVIAALFSVLAARSLPGHTEQEALRVRRQAIHAARGALAFTAAVPAVTWLLTNGRQGNGRWRVPFMR